MARLKGQVLPGRERRATQVDWQALSIVLGVPLYRGTLNVFLEDPLPDVPWEAWIDGQYFTHPCWVPGPPRLNAWLFMTPEEDPPPPEFVEIIAPWGLREALRKQDFPSFPVELEIGL